MLANRRRAADEKEASRAANKMIDAFEHNKQQGITTGTGKVIRALDRDDFGAVERDIETRTNAGTTALFMASYSGNVDVVESLLNRGARVDRRKMTKKQLDSFPGMESAALAAKAAKEQAEAETAAGRARSC